MIAPLHMLRLDPDPMRVARWAAAEKLDRRAHDDGYTWHALLAAAFGPHAPKPFRVVERDGRPPQLLGYTASDAAALEEHANRFADPAVVAALGLVSLAIKRMPDAFPAELALAFDIRVRPTVRQDRDGDRTKSRERDAFLVAVEAAGPRDGRADLERAAVYGHWLGQRLERGGAHLTSTRIVSLSRGRLLRRDGERHLVTVGGNGGGGPDAILSGSLVVKEPEKFRALLAGGVGRHRSFGFGMLLLRPADGE